jgi:hypothetical protein
MKIRHFGLSEGDNCVPPQGLDTNSMVSMRGNSKSAVGERFVEIPMYWC